MTTPCERTRALMETRELLLDLRASGPATGVPAAIRIEAGRLLRHFRDKPTIDWMATRMPGLVSKVYP
jgi:hypothetical protein